MSRRIIFLSTSFFCFSLLHGSGFAASSLITSKPLPAPITEEQTNIVLAQATTQTQKTIKNAQSAIKGKTLSPKTPKMPNTPKTPKMPKMPDSGNMGKNLRGKAGDLVNKNKSMTTTKTLKKTDQKLKPAGTAKTEALETTSKKKMTKKRGTSSRTQNTPAAAPMRETTLQKQNRRDAANFKPVAGSNNCICIKGQYCIGPRDGHYCYTSGGNKRYLRRN